MKTRMMRWRYLRVSDHELGWLARVYGFYKKLLSCAHTPHIARCKAGHFQASSRAFSKLSQDSKKLPVPNCLYIAF